jgi:hypothetical protein
MGHVAIKGRRHFPLAFMFLDVCVEVGLRMIIACKFISDIACVEVAGHHYKL